MSVPAVRSSKQRPAQQSKSAPTKSELLSTTAAPQYQHRDGDSDGEAAEHHTNEASTLGRTPTAPALPPPPSTSPHHRQGDRGSKDNDAAACLPVFVRFHDLRAAGIVSNWPQVYNLIDDYGFPPGQMLSPNTRAWRLADVQHWLDARPSERKKVIAPPRAKTEEAAP